MCKIIVGLTAKRPGPEQYSSDGYHVTVELEKEIASREDFHRSVRGLFNEVKTALDVEIAQGGNGSPPQTDPWRGHSRPENGHRATSAHQAADGAAEPGAARRDVADGGNGNGRDQPISNKQARYLTQLLTREGLKQQAQVTEWLHQQLGVVVPTIYELSKSDASRAIEALRGVQKGGRR